MWGALAAAVLLGAGAVATGSVFGTPGGVASGAVPAATAPARPASPPPGGPAPATPAPGATTVPAPAPGTPAPGGAPAPATSGPGTPPAREPAPAETAGAAPTPRSGPVRPAPGRADGAGSGMVAQVAALVNAQRVRAGCRPVAVDARLNRAALRHSRDMGLRGYFDHVSPEGRSVGDRVTAEGYAWSAVGENVAAGPESAAEAMRGWMASPGHRANVLDCAFTHMGLGVEGVDTSGGPHWTQVFAAPAK